jgi:hypothetical protein
LGQRSPRRFASTKAAWPNGCSHHAAPDGAPGMWRALFPGLTSWAKSMPPSGLRLWPRPPARPRLEPDRLLQPCPRAPPPSAPSSAIFQPRRAAACQPHSHPRSVRGLAGRRARGLRTPFLRIVRRNSR